MIKKSFKNGQKYVLLAIFVSIVFVITLSYINYLQVDNSSAFFLKEKENLREDIVNTKHNIDSLDSNFRINKRAASRYRLLLRKIKDSLNASVDDYQLYKLRKELKEIKLHSAFNLKDSILKFNSNRNIDISKEKVMTVTN
ncbi:hypothetical protein ACG2LH_01655 [Zhouia sp. PK063]|uniref:hypothetical protein n=1 Tax=Zhouia sp. PK063 TaxID=3373602 RepID=UPI0037A7184E